MSQRLPKLISRFDYTENSGGKWRFTLNEEAIIYFSDERFGLHDFKDAGGRLWASVHGRYVWIAPKYSWDGASPKFLIAGKWIGTPDYKSTRLATLFHDVLYQWLHLQCLKASGITRLKIDRLFGDVMRSQGFAFHWMYSGAVMAAGGIHRAITGGKRSGTCAFHYSNP